MLAEFWHNFRKNLFKPLLLFFYMGFAVPLLKVAFEFPHIIYQGLTIYLLVSIGWKGGEELAELTGADLAQALKFMSLGFVTNFVIGIIAYVVLRGFVKTLRRIDAATVAAYYGSDSAGTFVTCVGVLAAANIAYAAYMPVMLAVMEIPGCLVGLFLVSRLRKQGMDALGTMQDEPGYNPQAIPRHQFDIAHDPKHDPHAKAVKDEKRMALEDRENGDENGHGPAGGGLFSAELLREVFLNPGLFLLFGGIVIGWVSRLQGHKVTDVDDSLFVALFQGMLCLFLLEMGMTASKRLVDLKTAGWRFIVFGLAAPNIFAISGICVAHIFAHVTHTPLQLGTYALFAVLCGAASYIAVPAIQRLAIPEASPTLPLAASLGLTFSYNVTVGIPVYIMVAQLVLRTFPVAT
ncbi:MAG: sodium-dependent bicarbonate transport family permease [Deltaproteobacteria bacterium]